jgi:hypothetical protein
MANSIIEIRSERNEIEDREEYPDLDTKVQKEIWRMPGAKLSSYPYDETDSHQEKDVEWSRQNQEPNHIVTWQLVAHIGVSREKDRIGKVK